MAQSEVLDQFPVPVDVFSLQVLEEPPSAAHHLEEAAATVMVVLVGIEVTPEVIDPRGKNGDLDLGAPTSVLVGLILPDDLLFVDTHHCFRIFVISALDWSRAGKRCFKRNVAGASGRRIAAEEFAARGDLATRRHSP